MPGNNLVSAPEPLAGAEVFPPDEPGMDIEPDIDPDIGIDPDIDEVDAGAAPEEQAASKLTTANPAAMAIRGRLLTPPAIRSP